MTERTGGELAGRLAVAALGIPAALGVGYLGGYWLAGFIGLLTAVAAWEFFAMNRKRGVGAFPRAGSLLALSFVLLAAAGESGFVVRATLITLLIGVPVVLTAPLEGRPAVGAAVTLFGALYTGGLAASAVWLRDLGARGPDPVGAGILFLPVAATWIGDTAAYTVGRLAGRHRMAPVTSPGKTWEGAIAGLLATVAACVVYVELTRPIVGWTLPLAPLIGFGVVVAIAGQVGDLLESKFKRDCGVKDSSALLPGHGGVLDRLDSLLLVFPASYAYLAIVGV
jgi:phosphatidate cytidylyltransferase